MTALRSHPRRRRSLARGLLLVAVAFLGGMGVRGLLFTGGDTEVRDRSVVTGSASGAGPSRMQAGIPVGFSHDEAGASAAAAAYMRTGQVILDADPAAAEAAVRAMAAAGSADAQVERALGQRQAVHETLAEATGPLTWRQAALEVRLEGYTPERARVAVWHVGVLSAEGAAPPQANWSLSSYELVWESGDWKIWSQSASPGPAPVLDDSAAPATSTQLESALAGFEAV